MISEQFEKMIMCGKANHRVINLASSVHNHNVGKGSNVIVESIRVHPMQFFYWSGTPLTAPSRPQLEAQIKLITEFYQMFTLTAYANREEKHFTFKNNFKIDFDVYESSGGAGEIWNIIANSMTELKQDVFWNFKAENLQIEVSQVGREYDTVSNVSGNAPNRSKENNPTGFENPLKVLIQSLSNFSTKPMGRETANHGTGIVYNDLVIPKIGTGTAPTTSIPGQGGTNSVNVERTPLINVGIIEY